MCACVCLCVSSYLILAQKRCTHVLHLEHSIIGLPANGRRQKHVTRFQDSSSLFREEREEREGGREEREGEREGGRERGRESG